MRFYRNIFVQVWIIGFFSSLLLSCAINHNVAVLDIDLASKEEQIYKVNLFSEKNYNYSKSTIQGPYCLLIADSLLLNQSMLDSIDPKPQIGVPKYGKVLAFVSLIDTLITKNGHLYRAPFQKVSFEIGCFWLPMTIQSWDAEIRIRIEEIDPALVSGLKNPKLLIKLVKHSGK